MLDRIVGFKLSPVLWKKVKPALSAGRVQSVAVRLIVEREREIQQFKSEESYRVVALFTPANSKDGTEIKAELNQRFKNKEEATRFLESCKSAAFTIRDIATRPQKRMPAAPFTTSTLQQEAAHKLGFTVAQTMMIAQRLYESGCPPGQREAYPALLPAGRSGPIPPTESSPAPAQRWKSCAARRYEGKC